MFTSRATDVGIERPGALARVGRTAALCTLIVVTTDEVLEPTDVVVTRQTLDALTEIVVVRTSIAFAALNITAITTFKVVEPVNPVVSGVTIHGHIGLVRFSARVGFTAFELASGTTVRNGCVRVSLMMILATVNSIAEQAITVAVVGRTACGFTILTTL
jgi:hypothetical protein